MTCGENLARLLPLHYQRICELTRQKELLNEPSRVRWLDLAGLFVFSRTEEGFRYWDALATGNSFQ